MEFVKHDQAKPRPSLFPWRVFAEVLADLEYGARKYEDSNWQKCTEPTRYWDALMRHAIAWKLGEKRDHESDQHHLACVIVNAAFLLWLEVEGVSSKNLDEGTCNAGSAGGPLGISNASCCKGCRCETKPHGGIVV